MRSSSAGFLLFRRVSDRRPDRKEKDKVEVRMETIDFDKMQGLAPAVVQDVDNGEVLMVGFMNREALEKTLRGGYVTFYSRTRHQLWTKGETSGNRLRLIAASTDCDRDTVLCRCEWKVMAWSATKAPARALPSR